MKTFFVIAIALALVASEARADSKETVETYASITGCLSGGAAGLVIAGRVVDPALPARSAGPLVFAAGAGLTVGGCVAGVAGANYLVEQAYAPDEAELSQENSED